MEAVSVGHLEPDARDLNVDILRLAPELSIDGTRDFEHVIHNELDQLIQGRVLLVLLVKIVLAGKHRPLYLLVFASVFVEQFEQFPVDLVVLSEFLGQDRCGPQVLDVWVAGCFWHGSKDLSTVETFN